MNFRPKKQTKYPRSPVRKILKRDNKLIQAATVPKLACYNMRSLMPKVTSLATDLEDRSCSLAILTEVWEKLENKKHQLKLEELYEMKGLKYISTPRPGKKRGGGAAIMANVEEYTLTKLSVSNPHKLEIVWGLLQPKSLLGSIRKFIVCSFYCPPKSRKKTKLIDHMTFTLQTLRTIHPSAAVIISGDRNDLRMDRLLTIDSSLKQIVNKPTRGPKILTVLLTDLEKLYNEPEVVPPVHVDNPSGGGVPSDHSGVVASPCSHSQTSEKRHKIARLIRPITDSGLRNIGQVFTQENWNFMDPKLSSTNLTDIFESYTTNIVDTFCPQKKILERPGQNPFMREDMKHLKRKIMREYERRGKSQNYFTMKKSLDEKIRSEKQKYKEKILAEVETGSRQSAYAAIKKLGAHPVDFDSGFTLPEHTDLGLTPVQSVELIAEHFAAISNTFDPIEINNFSPSLREKLITNCVSVSPKLDEHEVYKKLCKAKKPNSSVPGDLPKKVLREFTPELAVPVTRIFNSILSTHEYPRQWVKEYQIPIPKVNPPSSVDDLRNISKTSFFSKCFESFLADWLLPIVSPFIDPNQYGLKGGSISHYLLELLKFTHQYLDLRSPHAVVLALVDQSKAFNRVSHTMVIEDLHDMGVPPWLLKILVSYLSGRSMTMSYRGVSSNIRLLPGSSPQGAFLGIFLFIIKYNGASLRPHVPQLMPECSKKFSRCEDKHCLKHPKQTHVIYVDDLGEAEAINLDKQLIPDPSIRPLPRSYHERTNHILPPQNSLLQKQLLETEKFSKNNLLQINESKSKVMIFNTSRKFDFPPEFSFENGVLLEVVNSYRLLGVIISADLRWDLNTKEIYRRALSKMWLLRRMKSNNLEQHIIIDYYIKEIRILAEHGVVIWNCGLTQHQIHTLEKIQKIALKITLGDRYTSYDDARKQFNLKLLSERRLDL